MAKLLPVAHKGLQLGQDRFYHRSRKVRLEPCAEEKISIRRLLSYSKRIPVWPGLFQDSVSLQAFYVNRHLMTVWIPCERGDPELQRGKVPIKTKQFTFLKWL